MKATNRAKTWAMVGGGFVGGISGLILTVLLAGDLMLFLLTGSFSTESDPRGERGFVGFVLSPFGALIGATVGIYVVHRLLHKKDGAPDNARPA